MPVVGDSLRWWGAGGQTDTNVESTAYHDFNFIEDFTDKRHLTHDVPKFKTNTRIMTRRAIAKTTYEELSVKGRVDSTEFGWLLRSGFGAPVSASNTHTFKAGGSWLPGGANCPLLSTHWGEGLSGLYWKMLDGRVNKLDYTLDAMQGTISYDAIILGPNATPVSASYTPVFSPPPDFSPFAPWQTLISVNSYTGSGGTVAVVGCITQLKWGIDNHLEPFYCTPIAAPISSTQAGLSPTRFTEGECEGTYDLLYQFLAIAGSSYQDFLFNRDEAISVVSTDPAGQAAGSLTYLPTAQFDLPNVSASDGEIQRDKPNVFQHLSGILLWDGTDATNIQATMINGRANYNPNT